MIPDTTLPEFLNAKKQLEDDIRAVVQDHIDVFAQSTGFTPSDISIDMGDVTKQDDLVRQYAVIQVRTTVPIDTL